MTSDLTTQLRAARPVAPPELRERVRAIASQEDPQRTALPFGRIRIPRLRFAVVPVAAALVLVSSALVFGLARSGSNEAIGTDLEERRRRSEAVPRQRPVDRQLPRCDEAPSSPAPPISL